MFSARRPRTAKSWTLGAPAAAGAPFFLDACPGRSRPMRPAQRPTICWRPATPRALPRCPTQHSCAASTARPRREVTCRPTMLQW